MIHLHQPNEPFPLSKTVHHMAQHVLEQAQMLMMDISNGTQASSVESRLGCISGAVLQLENLLESYRRIDADQEIYDPTFGNGSCENCQLKG